MQFKNKIINILHLLRNLILKVPFFKNLYLFSEGIIFFTHFKKYASSELVNMIKRYNNKLNLILKKINQFDKRFNFKDKVILEIGPGKNFILALLLIRKGAKKVYLVDRYKQIYNWDFKFFLKNRLIKLFFNDLNYPNPPTLKDLKDKIIYFKNIPIEKFNYLKNNSIDFIISFTVLEHVFDLDLAIKKTFSLLKPFHYMFHLVDLKDHFHTWDMCYLNFLKYPRRFWSFFGDTNRERISTYNKLFLKYDFRILEIDSKKIGPLSKIDIVKINFYKDFKNLSNKDLSIRGFNIIAQKK